jgi:hypothetical protein
VDEWLLEYDAVGKENNYTDEQIKEYKKYIDMIAMLGNDMLTKSDIQALNRCIPCSECGIKPVWGAAFLVCPKCGKESLANHHSIQKGYAVRSWNKINKEFILSFCKRCYQMTNHLNSKCQKCKEG